MIKSTSYDDKKKVVTITFDDNTILELTSIIPTDELDGLGNPIKKYEVPQFSRQEIIILKELENIRKMLP